MIPLNRGLLKYFKFIRICQLSNRANAKHAFNRQKLGRIWVYIAAMGKTPLTCVA